MNEPRIKRYHRMVALTLTSTEPTSSQIRYDDVSGGGVELGTMSTAAATLAVWSASEVGGTFRKLRKVDGTAVEITLSPSSTE